MFVHILKHDWSNPIRCLTLFNHKNKLHSLAKNQSGYKGLKVKWGFGGIYLMTLWNSEEDLMNFLEQQKAKQIIESKMKRESSKELKIHSYNFVPWSEVKDLLKKHGN